MVQGQLMDIHIQQVLNWISSPWPFSQSALHILKFRSCLDRCRAVLPDSDFPALRGIKTDGENPLTLPPALAPLPAPPSLPSQVYHGAGQHDHEGRHALPPGGQGQPVGAMRSMCESLHCPGLLGTGRSGDQLGTWPAGRWDIYPCCRGLAHVPVVLEATTLQLH